MQRVYVCLHSLLSVLVAGISPSGVLPVLEFDGKVLTESKAILSYVAREFSKYQAEHNKSLS